MISKLMIVAGFKDGRSYLKDAYFSRPFRIANVGQYKTDKDLYLMIMSASPGLLDNDHYDISIKVEGCTRLQLQSQAYQRLHNMQEGATQKILITLEQGSAFSYVPHPIVPHRDSKFKSHTVAHLQKNCQFLLSEIITCGRKHSGEVFRFTYLQNLLEVYDQRKLLLKDNLFLQPKRLPLNTIGQLDGFTHQGVLVYISTGVEAADLYANEVAHLLEKEKDVCYGISGIAANGFVLRILGNGGEQLLNCFASIQEKLWHCRPAQQPAPPVY